MKKDIRLSIKIVIKDKEGRGLIIRRSAASKANAHKWDFPGGKVDPGESFDDSLYREVMEETGLKISILKPVGVAYSEMPSKKVFYLFLEGQYESGELVLSSEHEESAWVDRRKWPEIDFCEHFKEFIKEYVQKP